LADGTVRTFGRNGNGQLGVGDGTNRSTPVQVFGISSSATAVAGGIAHTAVLLADGTVRTFGHNISGELGLNDTAQRYTPVQVFGISSSATAVACGYRHTAVLLADGTVRTFGENNRGQLGINITSGTRQTPVQVVNISTATAVACGRYLTVILLADGTVRTVGTGISGQLGINASSVTRQTPVQVFDISSSATAIACHRYFTAVLLADGTVRTFGGNYSGQLGVNDNTDRLTPVQVFGISSSAVAIACGAYFTTVLLADGTVRAFGGNDSGQLGINESGGTSSRLTPVTVLNITNATAVKCGTSFTAVLLANGMVRTFGGNDSGQLGVNDTTNRSTAVTVFGPLGAAVYPTYVTAQALALGLSAPTFQLDLSTDGARKLSTTTWTTGSDSRIKSDIQSANLARCVDIVDSLDLKYFKWDIPGVAGPTDSHSLGWIAQEVKEFFPNSVRETQDYGFDDFHNLDSDQLIKTMYGALKKMCSDTYGQ
jgi:alpha-tubulin suppressor-like RCC1 family protein